MMTIPTTTIDIMSFGAARKVPPLGDVFLKNHYIKKNRGNMIFCRGRYPAYGVVVRAVFVWYFLRRCLIKKTQREEGTRRRRVERLNSVVIVQACLKPHVVLQ